MEADDRRMKPASPDDTVAVLERLLGDLRDWNQPGRPQMPAEIHGQAIGELEQAIAIWHKRH